VLSELYSVVIGLGVFAVVGLTALYLLYERILVVLAWLLHSAFICGLLLASSALLLGSGYSVLGSRAVAQSGVPVQLRAGDAFVERVQRMPQRLYERIRYPFSSPTLEPLPPQRHAPGILEQSILPELERLATGSLRLFAFFTGLGLMSLGLVSRSSVDLVLTDRALRHRLDTLEQQLEKL